jgi:hypothetical protein
MRRHHPPFPTCVVLAVVVVSAAASYAQDSGDKAARASVEKWLSLVDNQDYPASWTAAAGLFRNAITTEKWEEAVRTARGPFGPLKTRVLKSATTTTSLPGAPDGQYIVFQFNTAFEKKAAALETVTAIREQDGSWRVGGYFVK